MPDRRDHYSYAVYAKKETAESFERTRFGGPIGDYMRRRQEEQLREWLGDVGGRRILDVGAGTGRTALPLAAAGAQVTALDASPAMLDVARGKAEEAGLTLSLDTGDALQLPYADAGFDAVLCFRVLLHVLDWRRALAEACRCSGGLVILDFPPRWSLAALQAPARALAALFKRDTQRFRLFTLRRMRRELRRNGFAVERVDKLFVLPIALHKLCASLRFTLAAERLLGRLGLRRLFGAPVTIVARRVAPAAEDRAS